MKIIAAVNRVGVIGNQGGLPWHCPDDLRHFRALTTGRAVVMGRTTFEGLPGPLRDRDVFVLTRDPNWSAPGVRTLASWSEAEALARTRSTWIAGGAHLYQLALHSPVASELFLTRVDNDAPGDTLMPDIPDRWDVYRRARGQGCTFEYLIPKGVS